MSSEPKNKQLWERVKDELRSKHVTAGKRWNAYLSGQLVQEYKRRGGEFKEGVRRDATNLRRWFDEQWADVGGKAYPVYRPTRRVNEKTPLTAAEVDPANLMKQAKLKQKLKGAANLPPFKKK